MSTLLQRREDVFMLEVCQDLKARKRAMLKSGDYSKAWASDLKVRTPILSRFICFTPASKHYSSFEDIPVSILHLY